MMMTQLEKIMGVNPKNPSLCYGLGIDTTGAVLTLTLGTATAPPRNQSWHLERDLSAQLHPLLGEFLKPQQWTDLAWIAVVKGPGSFTGTRLGVVTARTLAQQLNLPLFGLSNLAIAAWMAAHQPPREGTILSVSQPGQRGYIYGAIYEVQLKASNLIPLHPDQLFSLEAWGQLLVAEQNRIDRHIKQDALSADSLKEQLNELLGHAMLTLGWNAWHQDLRPNWREVLPYYG
jgi:tRNA threonylcarbamoyl adenosine modification protein YeaZ